jgi:hypothetical protein
MDNQIEELKKEIDKLKREISELKTKRIFQWDLMPDVVKTRHMGGGNRYFYAGLAADRPDGAVVPNSVTCYFATDTNVLSIWNGSSWVSETLT